MTAVTDPGATDCDTPGERHSPQLRNWDTAHTMQLQDPTPDKGLWPGSHISFMSTYGKMTDLGTLVPNLSAMTTAISVISFPSDTTNSIFLYKTKASLVEMDWVMKHQSPGGVPAQLPTAALSPHSSQTQGQHGKPSEEIQLPFVKATESKEGEGRSKKPSISLQIRLCSSTHGWNFQFWGVL